ncbi:EAL domain-containing protein [Corallincola spongiicola]|uniref:cyclic-guanylate-specific phosphodiesterase n=1 Tax=Corallincola spongiicola TaxID=2520508 RepID=A0ABY1WSV6_9GAMM|nr:EAL domain-containing protein [Corallincola spongiicola]TAA47815.1 EAL domain-containing protein [Corallincola spongiicola]
MPTLRVRDGWVALILSLLVTVGLGFVLAYTLVADIRVNQLRKAEYVLHEVEKRAVDTTIVIKKLNALGYQFCDQRNLLAMRRALFQSDHIKDIGFFIENNLVCTTGMGMLETPVAEDPPDLIDLNGYSLWVDRPLLMFDMDYQAIMVRKDRYNVVLDPRFISHTTMAPFSWQLVARMGDEVEHVFGVRGTFIIGKSVPGLFSRLGDSYYTHCSTVSPYCVALDLNQLAFAHGYGLVILLLLLVSFCVGGGCFAILTYLFRRHRSDKQRIKRGLAEDAFYCLYQPIVDLRTEQVIGCEMLARFEDNQGPMSPDRFIPFIRELDRTWLFTRQLISKAMDDLSTISGVGVSFRVSFNIFPQDVTNDAIAELPHIPSLKESPFDIVFEITEDEYLDGDSARRNLAVLHQAGFSIAIDDFGTGYSNFNQLKKLHCQLLKIDRTFVFDMEEGSIKSSLIKHIVAIAHGLGLKVVAEGVENKMQRDALVDLDVEYGQGWAFGKPMPIAQLNQLLQTQRNSAEGQP